MELETKRDLQSLLGKMKQEIDDATFQVTKFIEQH